MTKFNFVFYGILWIPLKPLAGCLFVIKFNHLCNTLKWWQSRLYLCFLLFEMYVSQKTRTLQRKAEDLHRLSVNERAPVSTKHHLKIEGLKHFLHGKGHPEQSRDIAFYIPEKPFQVPSTLPPCLSPTASPACSAHTPLNPGSSQRSLHPRPPGWVTAQSGDPSITHFRWAKTCLAFLTRSSPQNYLSRLCGINSRGFTLVPRTCTSYPQCQATKRLL